MTALLETIKQAGVTVEVANGKLKARGPQDAVSRLLPVLKERKPELLRLLADNRPASVELELQPVLRWLVYIGETDREIIAEVLERCRVDSEAKRYFLLRALEVPPPAKAAKKQR